MKLKQLVDLDISWGLCCLCCMDSVLSFWISPFRRFVLQDSI